MIARSERDARRQAAIAERRKALFEMWAKRPIKKAIIEIGVIAGDMYEQGGVERIQNLLKEDASKIMAPVLNDLHERIIETLGKEAKTSSKALRGDVETKSTDEDIDVVTREMLTLFEQYAIATSVELAETITEDVAKHVARVIAENPELIQQGPRAVASSIQSFVKDQSLWKAERIARTETLLAYSEAQNKFTEEIWDEVEDGPMYKKWYANRDSRARDDHKKMNGRVVRQGEKFRMPNGDELDYPGDRRASYPESIIQCRCNFSTLPEELIPQRQRRG